MRPPTLLRLVLLGFGVSASPLSNPLADADPCTSFPSWSVSDFTSTAADAVGGDGKATFKLINNLTSVSDTITCNLQVSYRCVITGTPSDKDLIIHVGLRAETLTLQLDRVVGACPGRTAPLHVIGNGELFLECTGTGHGGTVSCVLGPGEDKYVIEGVGMELAP
ncbi:hypothetical protein B0T16DRAFT_461927 [Cercophora newfieldiana]|uniref:AA1-like domain-containing protein n=1 Tax=Cercophora newfieldiana TaxID=92897 RepID=A0AA40CKM6_9PEZI|nr:hypothetical protein B0T16DRAFT_461927 [Cercophora newfieldiana]